MSDNITLPYRIFGVDPATTKSGWCVIDVLSLDPLKVGIIDHGLIEGQKLLKTRKEMVNVFSKQFCVLDALYEEYCRLLEIYKPDIVVSEGAYSHLHVSACIALTLAIHTLRRASQTILGYINDVVTIPPTISKLAATGHGGADKDGMRHAYETSHDLLRLDRPDISEHEIDSIWHAYGYVRVYIVKDIIQISAKDKRHARLAKQKIKDSKT